MTLKEIRENGFDKLDWQVGGCFGRTMMLSTDRAGQEMLPGAKRTPAVSASVRDLNSIDDLATENIPRK